jgi:hypothetical protein
MRDVNTYLSGQSTKHKLAASILGKVQRKLTLTQKKKTNDVRHCFQVNIDVKDLEIEEWQKGVASQTGGYIHPQLVNGKLVDDTVRKFNEEPVYIHVAFCRPGRQFWIVDHQKEQYVQKTIIRTREEDIVEFNKKVVKTVKEFDIAQSVFSEYAREEDSSLHKDSELWRIKNFVKKEAEQEELMLYLA